MYKGPMGKPSAKETIVTDEDVDKAKLNGTDKQKEISNEELLETFVEKLLEKAISFGKK